jgi:uncharacterized protein (DUF2236 family)
VVTRQELEDLIALVRRRVSHPRGGIYGPGSVGWFVNREVIHFVGGGRAALLQLAHPFIAYGVGQHSQTQADPLGRFHRTFFHVYKVVYGDLEHAIQSARRVFAIHERVRGIIDEDVGRYPKGSTYTALDESALFWVYATLIDTSVRMYELVVSPLSRSDKERYYEESRLLAYLFGVSDRVLPPSYEAFEVAFDALVSSDAIAVSRPAREIATFLLRPWGRIPAALALWYRPVTSALLPAKLREPFGLRYGAVERALWRASIPPMRAAYGLLPTQARYVPAFLDARRRVRGIEGRDRLGHAFHRAGLDLALARFKRP